MPYIGFATFAGDSGMFYHPGFSIGTLIGGRLNPTFSINAELRIDTVNFKNVPSGMRWEASEFDFDFSPLFHVPFATGEFVVGPKIGFAGYQEHDTDGGLETYNMHWTGLSVGVNGGVFFAVSRFMSLGGLLSLTVRDPERGLHQDPQHGRRRLQDPGLPGREGVRLPRRRALLAVVRRPALAR